ncbi:MAG: serine protease [Deferribacterales bacterium]
MYQKNITEQLFFTTVRIECVYKDGQTGQGTGFLYSYDHDNKHVVFVVTNKHVVINAAELNLTFLKHDNMEPILGEKIEYKLSDNLEHFYFGHPDSTIDVAIFPMGPIINNKTLEDLKPFLMCIDKNITISPEQIKDSSSIESIIFVGYPKGIWDSKNYLPVVRRGITASPIGIDYEGKPCFLIDASVFGGSSGSPVFIYDQNIFMSQGKLLFGSRVVFIGIVASTYTMKELIELKKVSNQKEVIEHNETLDLGVVFKARTIIETIEAYLERFPC